MLNLQSLVGVSLKTNWHPNYRLTDVSESESVSVLAAKATSGGGLEGNKMRFTLREKGETRRMNVSG